MRINRMLAMFYENGTLLRRFIGRTKPGLIDEIQKHFGLTWPDLVEQYGYRIEKIVVLRADEWKAEIKAAEDKQGKAVLELACKVVDEYVTPAVARIIRETYRERYEQG